MRIPLLIPLLVALIAVPSPAASRDSNHTAPASPIGWLNLQSGARQLSVADQDTKKAVRRIPRGEVVPVFQTKEKRRIELARVASLNLATDKTEMGWVEIRPADVEAPDKYPRDSELLRSLGGTYLDDESAAHTEIARFLVRQAHGPPVLLCYVLTAPLSMAELVVFTPSQGKFLPGDSINITFTDMQSGIISLELRKLLGDDSDCVITKETFRKQAQMDGTNIVIRTVADGRIRVIWQAPIEFKNFSQYNSKIQILRPPERNVGAPGTRATGEVTFRPNGGQEEPVWSGKVDFFVFGREKPFDSVQFEKACPWTGTEFAPSQ